MPSCSSTRPTTASSKKGSGGAEGGVGTGVCGGVVWALVPVGFGIGARARGARRSTIERNPFKPPIPTPQPPQHTSATQPIHTHAPTTQQPQQQIQRRPRGLERGVEYSALPALRAGGGRRGRQVPPPAARVGLLKGGDEDGGCPCLHVTSAPR